MFSFIQGSCFICDETNLFQWSTDKTEYSSFIFQENFVPTYLLKLLLSYTRQAPASLQDSCHRMQESSIRAPKIIGAGIVPKIRTTIHWMPNANDLCSLWTHLKSAFVSITQYKIKSFLPPDESNKWKNASTWKYLNVADSAGIVLRNVKNITKKHKLTKYHKFWQLVLHMVLIASYPRSSVLFGADMHSQSR